MVPLAEQYATIPEARDRIDSICALIRSAAVCVEDADALADVLSRPVFADVIKLARRGDA